jgi:glycerophosphoryl diester phosphodiesterase
MRRRCGPARGGKGAGAPKRCVFDGAAVDAVRSSAPSLATALLVGYAEDPFRALVTAREHGHQGMHPFFGSVDEALARAANAAGMAIRAWTVDDPQQIAELGELGVDAVITNDVTAARRALGRVESNDAGRDPGAS